MTDWKMYKRSSNFAARRNDNGTTDVHNGGQLCFTMPTAAFDILFMEVEPAEPKPALEDGGDVSF